MRAGEAALRVARPSVAHVSPSLPMYSHPPTFTHPGSVPVYLGAPDVHSFAPPNSFIDVRRFNSTQQLAAFILELHKDPGGRNFLQGLGGRDGQVGGWLCGRKGG